MSTASLLKQATAAVKAQETWGILRLHLGRSSTDYFAYPFASCRISGESSSVTLSVESSGIISRSSERKHIHFNEQVEQCIAVEANVDDHQNLVYDQYGFDSDSDDAVMMKRVKTKKRPISPRKTLKSKSATERKIIAMLPSATLKDREDAPETRETAMKHSRNPLISCCLYCAGWLHPPMRVLTEKSISSGSLWEESARMRRTPSGMFMPYEEGEMQPEDGIFGRVIDIVNTTRDIAHVISNVG
ncbi:protein phosphatase type 1 complex subunit Hex2/Reg1 [Fusarium oxysporum Fo47]|uniref:protein phosphatase type 1 complex subunit Hex2/Reg1 n=1 Tax=Fusarium oxysporum Fo47 TaxID=660027 RepID=UPI00286990FF|nr:protein phosphatase type 1 complex subunit Hex2/Reg1 [Fusarium oxysporum Fo47]WJG35761.1 protein phosphatase type 1 complex subunit Hex2/Reg1 [Fusarium oxysporum Fo47]